MCHTLCREIMQKPIIAFDVHNVIFFRDWGAIARRLISILRYHPHRWRLYLLLLNPFFWVRFLTIRLKTEVSDHIYDLLVEQYPSMHYFAHDFIALENMQRPDSKVVSFLQALRRDGYTLYLLSNIGQRALLDLERLFPKVICLFDRAFFPQRSWGYEQKPSTHFYRRFLSESKCAPCEVIFIDDQKNNVEQARLLGIASIHFTSLKVCKELLGRKIQIDIE